jgi:hypothetical protein
MGFVYFGDKISKEDVTNINMYYVTLERAIDILSHPKKIWRILTDKNSLISLVPLGKKQ